MSLNSDTYAALAEELAQLSGNVEEATITIDGHLFRVQATDDPDDAESVVHVVVSSS